MSESKSKVGQSLSNDEIYVLFDDINEIFLLMKRAYPFSESDRAWVYKVAEYWVDNLDQYKGTRTLPPAEHPGPRLKAAPRKSAEQ